jgi:predicted ArsR family transcriptional regulator
LKKINVSVRFTDMKYIMEGLTVEEMAKALGLKPTTVRQRLMVAGIRPKTKAPLYDASALEAIRNVPGKGRPSKAKPEAPEK